GRNLVVIGMHNPAHPGGVLQDWLEGMSVTEVARHLGVSRVGLSRVLHGQTGISPEMSIKLSEALGTSPDLWFKMQANYDFWIASRKKRTKVARLKRAA
ncbi:MAG: HigA family addiction module antitoxin, partial [Acidobacteriaceae bacterium]